MPLPKAVKAIQARHLGYGVTESPSPAPAGTVIFQTPSAGTSLSRANDSVLITVALHYHATATVPVVACSVGAPFASQPQAPLRRAPVNLGTVPGRYWRVYGYPGLVAPKGWSCNGFIAEDGGNSFAAVPPGAKMPMVGTNSTAAQPATPQVNVYGEPACESCKFSIACALFHLQPAWPGERCPPGPAAGEIDRRAGKYTVDFTDPPGVAGTGRPSGGADPTVGAVVLKNGAAILTCVLPPRTHAVCSAAVRAFTTYELALSNTGEVNVHVNRTIYPT